MQARKKMASLILNLVQNLISLLQLLKAVEKRNKMAKTEVVQKNVYMHFSEAKG